MLESLQCSKKREEAILRNLVNNLQTNRQLRKLQKQVINVSNYIIFPSR